VCRPAVAAFVSPGVLLWPWLVQDDARVYLRQRQVMLIP